MQATPVATTSLKPGQLTSFGTVKEARLSPSGKTMKITLTRKDGTEFTDRISAVGNTYVFTD